MFISVFLMIFSASTHAYTFKAAASKIKEHPQVMALINEAQALESKAKSESSWGDPILSIKASNFPQDSLADNRTPMTGIQFSLSQRVPLTTKYSKIEQSYLYLSKSQKFDALNQKRVLMQLLWGIAIEKRKFFQNREILKENLGWLKNMIKVSKRLYTNGKISQQALLELQIRQSELEAQISNISFSLKDIERQAQYLVGELSGELVLKSTPWSLLKVDLNHAVASDAVEKSFKKKLEASESMTSAQRLNYVPDLTISVGYTKRNDEVDDVGDFVSAGVGLSLPLSSKRYAQAGVSYINKLKMHNELKNYKAKRESELSRLKLQIHKVNAELSIIKNKSLAFAKGSRDITAKSYGLGGTSYLELLQSELKYQDLLMRKNELNADLAMKQVQYLFLSGDSLYEI